MSRNKNNNSQLSLFSGKVLDDLAAQEASQKQGQGLALPGGLFDAVEADIACKDCGRLAESCNCILE